MKPRKARYQVECRRTPVRSRLLRCMMPRPLSSDLSSLSVASSWKPSKGLPDTSSIRTYQVLKNLTWQAPALVRRQSHSWWYLNSLSWPGLPRLTCGPPGGSSSRSSCLRPQISANAAMRLSELSAKKVSGGSSCVHSHVYRGPSCNRRGGRCTRLLWSSTARQWVKMPTLRLSQNGSHPWRTAKGRKRRRRRVRMRMVIATAAARRVRRKRNATVVMSEMTTILKRKKMEWMQQFLAAPVQRKRTCSCLRQRREHNCSSYRHSTRSSSDTCVPPCGWTRIADPHSLQKHCFSSQFWCLPTDSAPLRL